ncbi:MAG: DUF1963 domain-containing protein [Phycisphaeraceae bacterium]
MTAPSNRRWWSWLLRGGSEGKAPSPALIAEWEQRLARQAVLMKLVAPSSTLPYNASWFGRVNVALPDETWPHWNDRPLWPLCQLNLTELPWRPSVLDDLEMITLFVDDDHPQMDEPNGSSWVLRAYPRLASLQSVNPPNFHEPPPMRAMSIQWSEPVVDFPTHDLLPNDIPAVLREQYYDLKVFECQDGSKAGGWPYCVQAEPGWMLENSNHRFAFQIGSEEEAHWMWGDLGTAYFGRDTNRESWVMDWQCY